ncbi:MAG: CHASE3 domain-containing protein, partial [Nitrospinota bacterium]|nr:CHASE3 domain-containing protein [Nitrospinota bacterium]
MKNPRLPGKIILSTALVLSLMGVLSSAVYSDFQNAISASYGKTTTIPPEMIEDNEQLDILSRTSPAWRQKLSKHIFITINQELQSLEQQLSRHNNTKGKRWIKRVKVSLEKMRSGKQAFMLTGQEASLAPFYTGRTVLEYNLWKLKRLTRSLKMDPALTSGLFRVYALMNKWLVYVAHREISARRNGTLGAPPLQTAERDNKESLTTAFPPISELARITEQELKDADEALSQQPNAVQDTSPDIDPEIQEPNTLGFFETDTGEDPKPGLLPEESVSPLSVEEGVESSETSPIPSWMLILGMIGAVVATLLIVRKKRKPSHPLVSPMSIIGHQSESSDHTTAVEDPDNELLSIDDFVTPATKDYGAPRGEDTPHPYVARQIEAWSRKNKTDDSTFNSETPENTSSQITVNLLENETPEDRAFQLEELTQELEILHAEKEEIAQGMENIMTENQSLTEQLETTSTEKENLETQ